MWPVLQTIRDLGGSAHLQEINPAVAARMGLTEEQLSIMHSKHQTEVDYRLAWARNYLKNIGALENSSRGVWSLSDDGSHMSEQDVLSRLKQYRLALAEQRLARRQITDEEAEGAAEDRDVRDWRDQLLAVLATVSPAGFERLCQRLLREAGFVNVTVTGKSGDGGIDGVGLYRPSLISFPVYFQCKRFAGSVGASIVRDFRGAMAGRGEKGLLITTGSFTREATSEASRDGATPIELIAGEDLCDLLKQYELGVHTRLIEEVTVIESFFSDYQ